MVPYIYWKSTGKKTCWYVGVEYPMGKKTIYWAFDTEEEAIRQRDISNGKHITEREF